LLGFLVKFFPAKNSSACTSRASAVSPTRQSPASFSSGLSPSTTTTLVSETRSSSSDRFLTCDGDDDDPFMMAAEDEETNSGETHSEGKTTTTSEYASKHACARVKQRKGWHIQKEMCLHVSPLKSVLDKEQPSCKNCLIFQPRLRLLRERQVSKIMYYSGQSSSRIESCKFNMEK